MRKYLIIGLSYILLILTVFLLYRQNVNLRVDRDMQLENVKAYSALYSDSEKEKRAFKLSLDQMRATNDSVFQKMLQFQKDLKIKDKNIEQLQYRLSVAKKTDSLILRDTVFRDSEFKLDTVFGDKWITQKLHLEYPGKVVSSPEITLENYVALTNKKETIKPRKKFFLWRWFQKKHTVTTVEVVEKNIYVKDSISRFVLIN